MVEPARSAELGADSSSVSGFRRQPAPGHAQGNRIILWQHRARGSQFDRSVERQLYVRERAASQALWNPQYLREQLPPRRIDAGVRRPPRTAGARQFGNDIITTAENLPGWAGQDHLADFPGCQPTRSAA